MISSFEVSLDFEEMLKSIKDEFGIFIYYTCIEMNFFPGIFRKVFIDTN